MADRDTIVVGASLGGVNALPQFVASLPEDLAASILVVMHMDPNDSNWLANRVARASPLPAAAAIDQEELRPGRIYVATPDHHLMIQGARIRLTRGPRENHSRPSIDALFRSAAYERGSRVIGIVLTGQLDDGTAGLWAIKDRGGIAIVQSPQEAAYPSMPASALRHVKVDYTLSLRDMPTVLHELTQEVAHRTESCAMADKKLEVETRIARGENALAAGVRSIGKQSFQTCPECHGSMVVIGEADFPRYRCHTGHAFTAASLAQQASRSIENTLWSALAQLEQYQTLLGELQRLAPSEDAAAARRLAELQVLTGQVRNLAMSPVLTPNDAE